MISHMGRRNATITKKLLAASLFALAGCATPAPTYMGIDTSSSQLDAKKASNRELLEVARTILFLNAHEEGCYNSGPIQGGKSDLCKAFAADIALINQRTEEDDFAVPSRQVLLASLARSAQAGSKDAQLALGIRFEEGRGVEMNLAKARKLYRLASRDTGGQQLVVSRGFFGSVDMLLPDDAQPERSGREEAQRRLAALTR